MARTASKAPAAVGRGADAHAQLGGTMQPIDPLDLHETQQAAWPLGIAVFVLLLVDVESARPVVN